MRINSTVGFSCNGIYCIVYAKSEVHIIRVIKARLGCCMQYMCLWNWQFVIFQTAYIAQKFLVQHSRKSDHKRWYIKSAAIPQHMDTLLHGTHTLLVVYIQCCSPVDSTLCVVYAHQHDGSVPTQITNTVPVALVNPCAFQNNFSQDRILDLL